jgi:hypothetical protein
MNYSTPQIWLKIDAGRKYQRTMKGEEDCRLLYKLMTASCCMQIINSSSQLHGINQSLQQYRIFSEIQLAFEYFQLGVSTVVEKLCKLFLISDVQQKFRLRWKLMIEVTVFNENIVLRSIDRKRIIKKSFCSIGSKTIIFFSICFTPTRFKFSWHFLKKIFIQENDDIYKIPWMLYFQKWKNSSIFPVFKFMQKYFINFSVKSENCWSIHCNSWGNYHTNELLIFHSIYSNFKLKSQKWLFCNINLSEDESSNS